MKRGASLLISLEIFILSIIAIQAESDKVKYVCASKLEEKGVCYLSTTDSSGLEVKYVKTCKSGKVCDAVTEDGFSKCYKKENSKRKDGKKCVANEECQCERCSQNKCTPLSTGEKCSSSRQCGIHGYCDIYTNKCEAIKAEGEECSQTNGCKIGLICDKNHTDLKHYCIEMFSKKKGADTYNEYTCESGYAKLGSDGKGNCAERTLSNKDCTKDEGCEYTIDNNSTKITRNDECVYKFDGATKTCSQGNGELWNNYIKIYKEEIEKIKKDDSLYASDFEDDGRYYYRNQKLKDAYIEWKESAILEGADDCIKDYFKYLSSSYIMMNLIITICGVVFAVL